MIEDNTYKESLTNDRDALNDIFLKTTAPIFDDTDEVLETPGLIVNLDDVNNDAQRQAKVIIERLSNYYFDEKYIKEHPYIPSKITQEMENIRRLLKMLAVNEKAQDSLIMNISCNAGKAGLYTSLTSIQNSTLSIQRQLDEMVANIESIFQKMQEECKTTFDSKEKEEAEDGSITVRGSRDFIKELTAKLYSTEEINEETTNVVQS